MFKKLLGVKKVKVSDKVAPALEGKNVYVSRSMLNLCKNEDCKNERRSDSAYCQSCSSEYNDV